MFLIDFGRLVDYNKKCKGDRWVFLGGMEAKS